MARSEQFGLAALLLGTLIGSSIANTARTCYTCEGVNCQRTTLTATQQCLDPLDYCVTVFHNFDVLQKGCSMEVPIELRARCDANTVECHKCNTDRCNNLGQGNYMCLQCDSSKDANCVSNPKNIAGTRCAAPTALNSYCFVKYAIGNTQRGCATSTTEQRECFADANCMLCLPGDLKNCNNVDFKPGTRAMKL